MSLSTLKTYKQFIVWKLVEDANAPKPLKVPVNYQTGIACHAHDAANWTDYDTAVTMAPVVGGTGVGFVLTPLDPICCVDLDACLQADGAWSPFATQMLEWFPGAAVELSHSGNGLHIWGSYDPRQLPANHKTRDKNVPGLEVYTSNRFIALGTPYHGDAGIDVSAPLLHTLQTYLPGIASAEMDWSDQPVPEWNGPTDDDELIAKMLASKQSAASAFDGKAGFKDLWEGNEAVLAETYQSDTGDAFDRSSADAALFSHLAFWTGKDCARMDRLFRRSALVRPKYIDRPYYQHKTITQACGWTKEVYRKPSKQETTIAGPTFPEHCLAVDGLLGEICQWIDTTAPKPQPILTLAAVLSALGALFGGRYAIDPMSTRPNLYCCGIAPTGGGKDHARKLLVNLFEEAGVGEYVMGSNVTSDSAILKSLERNSSQIGFFDEIGLLMRELSNSNVASHKLTIISVMMQLFSSAGSTFKGTEYADRQRSRIDIKNPCLCIYGTTTPEPLFSAFSSRDAVSGYLNRWLFFQGDQNPPPSKLDFSGKGTIKPPEELIGKLRSIHASQVFTGIQGDIIVKIADDAQAIFLEVWDEQEQKGPLWIRFFENMVKVAGIRAIADNHLEPVVNFNHAQWARDLVKWCVETMVLDVRRHVADGFYQKQFNKIQNLIINAGPNGITLSEISGKTTSMKAEQRNPILDHLVEAALVELAEEETPRSNKLVKRYRPINP